MAITLKKAEQLFEETIEQITADEKSWIDFLDFAANFYKYNFKDQVMIYAQNPDATACASYSFWSRTMQRSVNRGTKGIALFDEDTTKLKYVFDIGDTVGSSLPYKWQYDESKDKVLKESIEEISDIESFPDKLLFEDILTQLAEEKIEDGTIELDNESRTFYINSLLYMVYVRCGQDPHQFAKALTFENLQNVKTNVMILGDVISSDSGSILKQIGNVIKEFDFNKKSVEHSQKMSYNALKRESEDEKGGIENDNRTDIHRKRRVPLSESGERSAGRNDWEIRQDAQGIHETEHPEKPITDRRAGRKTSTESISDGDRPEGDGKDGRNRTGAGQEYRAGRKSEENRPDGMGSPNESDQSTSRGNDVGGSDLYLDEKDSYLEKVKSLSLDDFDETKEPYVYIGKSEHHILKEGMVLSLYDANRLFAIYDEEAKNDSSDDTVDYYKVNGVIFYYANGEIGSYDFRQDLGDGEGALLDHIKNEGPSKWKSQKDRFSEFIKYFSKHIELSEIEDEAHSETDTEYADKLLKYVATSREWLNYDSNVIFAEKPKKEQSLPGKIYLLGNDDGTYTAVALSEPPENAVFLLTEQEYPATLNYYRTDINGDKILETEEIPDRYTLLNRITWGGTAGWTGISIWDFDAAECSEALKALFDASYEQNMMLIREDLDSMASVNDDIESDKLNNKLIEGILFTDYFISSSKEEIAGNIAAFDNETDKIAYVKSLYKKNEEVFCQFTVDAVDVGFRMEDSHLLVWRGKTYISKTDEAALPWDEVLNLYEIFLKDVTPQDMQLSFTDFSVTAIAEAEVIEETNEITYTVAEVSEFHNLGELHEGITSIEEAYSLYKNIPSGRMSAQRAIGVTKKDQYGYDLSLDFLIENEIRMDILEHVQLLAEDKDLKESINWLIEHAPEITVFGEIKQKESGLNDISSMDGPEDISFNMAQMSLFEGGIDVSEYVIDRIIAAGGNDTDSVKRIYFLYQTETEQESRIQNLKSIYGVTNQREYGRGFEIDGSKYSMWIDAAGMKIAKGESCRYQPESKSLSWEEIDAKILNLISAGKYITKEEKAGAKEVVVKKLATSFEFMARELSDEARKAGYLENLRGHITRYIFGELIDRYIEDFLDPQKHAEAVKELKEFADAYEEDHSLLRMKIYQPAQILRSLELLNVDQKEQEIDESYYKQLPAFITQDEIDNAFTRGGVYSGSLYRTFAYFKTHDQAKDRVAFIKEQFGHGGSSSMEISLDYSPKGFKIERRFAHETYEKRSFKWEAVSRRIDELIKNDLYFAPGQRDGFYDYGIEALANKIDNFFSYVNSVEIPYERANPIVSIDKNIKVIASKIKYMDKAEHFYRVMQEAFLSMDSEDRGFDYCQNALEDLKQYIDGTYLCFDDMPKITPIGEMQSEIETELNDNFETEALEIDAAQVEVPSVAENYHITDMSFDSSGPKARFKDNILAIETLYKLEEINRDATPEEQEILSKYVGWGGLANAFDQTDDAWRKEYEQLKALLNDEEYESAKESVLNAHYTHPVIVKGMYYVLSRLGFTKGNMLEPACGIGNFFGMMPEEFSEMKSYGVEIDSISGRIAQKLYPKAKVEIRGFEETNYRDNSFDVAIGNVPFGSYKINDRKYNKNNFLIHDYFFAKTIDKVRPGGVIAFITSKGTMDKANSKVRKYIAERAALVGAVRLPSMAFKNAGTSVTSDIIFLQKRDRACITDDAWIHLGNNDDGITMNEYFVQHPEMVVGEMREVSGPYGMETACILDDESEFGQRLSDALSNITESDLEISEDIEAIYDIDVDDEESIAADVETRNYSYTFNDGKIYYRENAVMYTEKFSEVDKERVVSMIELRDITRNIIDMQLGDYSDDEIKGVQETLLEKYDRFVEKYGLINSRANKRAFGKDDSYPLLSSLEEIDSEGNLISKADIFYKRTVAQPVEITHVDTPVEALSVSLSEKACVDLGYMSQLCDMDSESVIEALKGIIYKKPETGAYLTADEYLSGNVREKLNVAILAAENDETYKENVMALQEVQPQPLTSAEIEVRLGATWIDTDFIDDFMYETFQTPSIYTYRGEIKTDYSVHSGVWNIKGKSLDRSVNVTTRYGTKRVSAYKILEDALNLRTTQVFDIIEEDGKEKRVLNKKETILAIQKQELIKEEFNNWIWKDPIRRDALCKKYNNIFNAIVPRTYDGEYLTFPGMNPEISLKKHQVDGVARQLYGGNTLLAYCVGAGKTFCMAAAAMESKRIGLAHKSLFVVPNHLIQQWAGEFLRLYPSANILAATKEDFTPANRKRFCSRIATGDYDAIIIGHSQFEKIPLSKERQKAFLKEQINEIAAELEELKYERDGKGFTVKQLVNTRKTLEKQLSALNDDTGKDSVVTFEELGVDRLFVDEAHNYKNLMLHTKMRNVAGITTTAAKKSSDLFAKCRYMDEITDGKGIVFATGTPISNSMAELYTMQKYLQYDTLKEMKMLNFDSWASTFGTTVTAIELAPEGTGYRNKTRFAKFYNLPELMSMFREVADIQTSDMLELPVPKANYHNITVEPTQIQKEMVKELGERAETVRIGGVDPTEDNMLKITNDGRKLALDQRLIDDSLDAYEGKVSTCADKAYQIWKDTEEDRSTQLLFCDLSIPKFDGTFNVYEELKHLLVEKGVPEDEIKFIHSAKSDKQKLDLFKQVRAGDVRFLIGSTAKMGAGTNVQDRLCALHHLDVPWRPSDIEQQEGRILRQGNKNEEVDIFRYVTEGTFDAYSWQIIENKMKYINQIMTSKSPVRSCEDVDEASLSVAEVKALAAGNPEIKEKMDLDVQVNRLKMLKSNYRTEILALEDDIRINLPKKIAYHTEVIEGLNKDLLLYENNKHSADEFKIKIWNTVYDERKEAGIAILKICDEQRKKGKDSPVLAGEYCGFELYVTSKSYFSKQYEISLKGARTYTYEISDDPVGCIQRTKNILEKLPDKLQMQKEQLEVTHQNLKQAEAEVVKPFVHEEELQQKMARLNELNFLLQEDVNPTEDEISEIQQPEFNPEPTNSYNEVRFSNMDKGYDM